jgi:hypothetical protein
MHVYIYDEYINNRRYDNLVALIETRITDLGLNGKIIRLGVMKNILDIIDCEIKRGAKTIIAVGNNITINQIANAIIKIETDNQIPVEAPLGIIPIGKDNNQLSSALGIPEGIDACDILASRRIECIDAGQANNKYFIASATISAFGTVIDMGKDFSVEILDPGEINIVNLPYKNMGISANPQDNELELIIKTKKKDGLLKNKISQSIFSVKKVHIFSAKEVLILDNAQKISSPAEIKVLKNKLKVIVGKDRAF